MDGQLAQWIVKRKLTADEKSKFEKLRHQLGLSRFYRWALRQCDSQDSIREKTRVAVLCLEDLSNSLKERIAECLAEKRVVQHVPARMGGLPLDLNMWRLHGWDENGKAILEKHSRNAEGKREQDTPKAGANNKQRLIGWNPLNGEGKLKKLKAVLITNENFGVAILDQAVSEEDRLKVIPFHKVFPFIFGKKEERKMGGLVAVNQGQMPRILRSGRLIRVPTGTHVGTWRIFSVKNNAEGLAVSLGQPDALACRKDKQNVGLKVLLRDGFQIIGKSLIGESSCPTTSSA